MTRTKIFATQIGNLTDARYFAANEAVQWLSFVCDPTDEFYLPPAAVAAIQAWVEGPTMVGAFGWQSAAEIRRTAEALQLSALQLPMFTPREDLAALSDYTLILKIAIEATTKETDVADLMAETAPFVKYFLLDFLTNAVSWSAGQPLSNPFLQHLCQKYAVFLEVDFDASTMPTILATYSLEGLCLRGGKEEQVGVKSFDELNDILEALEV